MSGSGWPFLFPAWNSICWWPLAGCLSLPNPLWILRCSVLRLSPTICNMTDIDVGSCGTSSAQPYSLSRLRLIFLLPVFNKDRFCLHWRWLWNLGLLSRIFFFFTESYSSKQLSAISFHFPTASDISLAILRMSTPQRMKDDRNNGVEMRSGCAIIRPELLKWWRN